MTVRLAEASDETIYRFATDRGFVVLTKDRISWIEAPPTERYGAKVVRLGLGICSVAAVHAPVCSTGARFWTSSQGLSILTLV